VKNNIVAHHCRNGQPDFSTFRKEVKTIPTILQKTLAPTHEKQIVLRVERLSNAWQTHKRMLTKQCSATNNNMMKSTSGEPPKNENMSYMGSSNYSSFSDDAATLEQLVGANMVERSLSNKTIMNNNHLVMA